MRNRIVTELNSKHIDARLDTSDLAMLETLQGASTACLLVANSKGSSKPEDQVMRITAQFTIKDVNENGWQSTMAAKFIEAQKALERAVEAAKPNK